MRTIIVGDVHGCRSELEALLDRVAFATGDRLVFVGDLVARGPDSLGVLDIVRRTGAIVVRGNHEQRLLDWRAARAPSATDETEPHSATRTEPRSATRAETRTEPHAPIGRMHRDIARSLRPVDWKLIEAAPFFVDLPEHGARVVHAGLVPGLPMEEQSPRTLMSIRTVRQETPARRGQLTTTSNVLWGAAYAGPAQVIFGHNAAPGLQLHAWATGLDTGCVYGGRLTAMVLGNGQRVPRSLRARHSLLVSEPARRVWFSPQRAASEVA